MVSYPVRSGDTVITQSGTSMYKSPCLFIRCRIQNSADVSTYCLPTLTNLTPFNCNQAKFVFKHRLIGSIHTRSRQQDWHITVVSLIESANTASDRVRLHINCKDNNLNVHRWGLAIADTCGIRSDVDQCRAKDGMSCSTILMLLPMLTGAKFHPSTDLNAANWFQSINTVTWNGWCRLCHWRHRKFSRTVQSFKRILFTTSNRVSYFSSHVYSFFYPNP